VRRELSKLLKVNVMGYDYTGYGASAGDMPSVGQTLSDITAVYEHLVSGMGMPPSSIILYGQSVGSGPTAYLGSLEKDLGGVVLHSPLLSGVRVLSPGLKWWPSFADVYPNHLMVPKIHAPTFIMHVSVREGWCVRGGGRGGDRSCGGGGDGRRRAVLCLPLWWCMMQAVVVGQRVCACV
jgi:hypothetical protein